jgi:hypothetical protein
MNYIEKKRNQIAENLVSSYSQDSIQAVSAAEFIEKGKKANLGEVREWGGGKYQKTTTGWVPYNEGGGKVKEHKEEGSKSSKEFEDYVDRAGKEMAKWETDKSHYSADSVETLRYFAKKAGMALGKSPQEIDKMLSEAKKKHIDNASELKSGEGSQSKESSSKEEENLKNLGEEVKGWDDEKLEEKAFKLRTFFKNTFGKIPSVDQLDPQDDKNEINLRKRLSIFSNEISRREKTVENPKKGILYNPSENLKDSLRKKSKDHSNVREWVDFSDDEIQSVIDGLDEAGVTPSDFAIGRSSFKNQEQESEFIQDKVEDLLSDFREGLQHKNLEMKDVRDIIWGLVMSKNDF